MRVNYFLMASLGLLLIGGCNSAGEMEYLTQSDTPESQEHSVPTRSVDEAIGIAAEWFRMETPTRSEDAKSIANVEYLTAVRPGSAASDTLLYLINYTGERGFAIVGAPVTSDNIYAFSEKGSISLADTVSNKGFASFIHATGAAVYASMAESVSETRVSIIDPGIGINPPSTTYSKLIREAKPMLPESVANWTQEYPYNQYCPFINGVQGVVGCVPLAIGQLLAYYKAPESISGTKLNWDAINNGNVTMISFLLQELASSNYCNSYYKAIFEGDKVVGYDPTVRSTAARKESVVFSKLGFGVDNCFDNFSMSTEANRDKIFGFMDGSLSESRYPKAPIIIEGSFYDTDNDKSSGRHCFVVDGYQEIGTYSTIFEGNPLMSVTIYLHCIWGDNRPGANGYYRFYPDADKIGNMNSTGFNYGYYYLKPEVYGKYIPPVSIGAGIVKP
ncbi:MAG: hypothetical protein HDR80_07615 [Bacteroides sp.]|nr:hypothetical protein [Bacteroides sp.]